MARKGWQKSPQDLYYLKPLHIWAKCAGILPNFDIDRLHAYKGPFWNTFVMLFLFTCMALYALYGKLFFMVKVFPTTIIVTDIGGDWAMVLSTLSSIVRLSLIKGKTVCRLLESLKRIDAELRTIDSGIRYPRKRFIIEFIAANILFIVYYAYDAYIWISSVTWNTYKFFVMRDIQCGHIIIVSLVIRNYALAIRNRMRILNALLRQLNPSEDPTMAFVLDWQSTSTMNKALQNKVLNDKTHVQKMRRIFARICRTIEIHNDIFGWSYVIMYIAIVAYLLTSSNIALVYGVGTRDIDGAGFGWQLTILCILWNILPLTIGYFIFSSAERCYYEFKKTPTICYSVIDQLTAMDQHNVLVPELEKFAQQVSNSHPEITAHGFFTVNYAIFFALIGSLSGYIIVLIQFM